MAKHIANFCIALSEHLRDGIKLDKLIYLREDEREYRGGIGGFLMISL